MEVINKDPAILLYTRDFLTQCMHLSMEERGQYITLLCIQHNRGHIDKKIINIQVGNLSEDVKNLFETDDNNKIYSKWLEEVIIKRKNYAESRRKNRLGKKKHM